MSDSTLSRALKSAGEILFTQDQATGKTRPDPHISTRWMFAEIDEANIRIATLSGAQKRARAAGDHAESARLITEMQKVHFQIGEMLKTAATVFAEYQKQEAGRAG